MSNHSGFLDDDKHICLRCKRDIFGLDNYIIHRKSNCHENGNHSETLSHMPPVSLVESLEFQTKPNVDHNNVNELFSNDAIDLSTSTKRHVNTEEHQQNILFSNVAFSSSSDNPKIDHSNLSKSYNSNESYSGYSEVDSYQPTFVTSRDQPFLLSYRPPVTSDPIRKEIFVGQQQFTGSSDIFHTSHESSNLTLFRSFDAFSEHFKGNQEVVDSSGYFPQSGTKYMTENTTFENKFTVIYPSIHSSPEHDSFLSRENNEGCEQYKPKLLRNSMEISTEDYHKPPCYQIEGDKGKILNCDLPECSEKNSCTVAIDCSKQEDLRQNDFLSSLELTKTAARKMMKYESDIDEDDEFDDSRPPSNHTGGKWPPGENSHQPESGKWMFSSNAEDDSHDTGFETVNDSETPDQPFHPPPPSYTKGKWLPGKRMTNVKYGTSVEYECKACDRILKGKTAYEKHLRSELHFVKENISNGLDDKSSFLSTERPRRLKKEKAQIFLKQKISQIKRTRRKGALPNEMKDEKHELVPKTSLRRRKINTIRLCADEDTDEEIPKTPFAKILCPICRLSFSEAYCSQHFASLAHIHNELEYNLNSCYETNEAYSKIVLTNISSIVKISHFLCKSCRFFTNSHKDLEHHLDINHRDVANTLSYDMKVIYRCSACSDENSLYNLSDLQRHLKITEHQRNTKMEIMQGHQVVISQAYEIKCSICQCGFRYNKAYRDHRRKFHGDALFQLMNQRLSLCSECPYQGINERHVRIHMKKKHSSVYAKSYFCFVCGLRFATRPEADSHRHSSSHRITLEKQKGKSTSRSCKICYSVFENLTILRGHMTECHKKDITPCPYCGIVPPLRSDLSVHRKSCSKEVVPDCQGSFKCDLCTYTNDLLAHVLMHTVFVHLEKKHKNYYVCHICKSQMQGRSVKNHMLLHTNELKFSCSFCSRRFSEQAWLRSHLEIVHSLDLNKTINENHEDLSLNMRKRNTKSKVQMKKKTLCEICGRTYTNRSHLKRHQQDLHVTGNVTVEAEFTSTVRERNRTKKGVLLSNKSLVCEVCGIICENTSEFKSHREGHRSEGSSSFPCPHCSYATPRMHHLRRHLRLHTGANPFQCHYCIYASNNQENLRKHMLKTQRHPGRTMYECQLCLQKEPEDESGDKASRMGDAGVGSVPFGTNYAVHFKEHLMKSHQDHFKDKEEVMRHIRSYYRSDQDSTYTDKPKLFKYHTKRRQRKAIVGVDKPPSSPQNNVEMADHNLQPRKSFEEAQFSQPFDHFAKSNTSTSVSQHLQFVPSELQSRISSTGISPVDHSRPDVSAAAYVITEEDTAARNICIKDNGGVDCYGYGTNPNSNSHGIATLNYVTSSSLPVFSSLASEILGETIPKKVQVFVNKEAKRAYILRNPDRSQPSFESDINIPVGAEVLLTTEESSSIADGQNSELRDPQPSTSSGQPTLTKKIKDIDKGYAAIETKTQNVVSKKVYLLVSNNKNIEDHLQDSLRWIDNF